MSRNRNIFIDVHGTLIDAVRFTAKPGLTIDLVDHAVTGLREVLKIASKHGYDVWLVTDQGGMSLQYLTDTVKALLEHLPEFDQRIIVCRDRGLLGDDRDILVTHRAHKHNAQFFIGALIHFGPIGTIRNWYALKDVLSRMVRHPGGAHVALDHELETPLEEINEARGLLRLGPVPESAHAVVPIMTRVPNPAGPGEVIGGRPVATRPVHGGYPGACGRFGGGRFGKNHPLDWDG